MQDDTSRESVPTARIPISNPLKLQYLIEPLLQGPSIVKPGIEALPDSALTDTGAWSSPSISIIPFTTNDAPDSIITLAPSQILREDPQITSVASITL